MMLTGQATVQAASDVRGFGYGEHLPVCSWRRIVTGRADCPVIAREFADAGGGGDAVEVLLAVCSFLKALAFAAANGRAVFSERRGFPIELACTDSVILRISSPLGRMSFVRSGVRCARDDGESPMRIERPPCRS